MRYEPPVRWPTLKRWVLTCVGLAYAVSWALPVFFFDGHRSLRGIEVLLSGWMGPVLLEFGWYANPCFLAACVALAVGRERIALGSSLVALLLGLTSFATTGWVFDEAELTPIRGLGAGFGLWLCAIALLAAFSVVVVVVGRRREVAALGFKDTE
ncbi:MAG: hypothetical protein EKK52_06400 [Burkholderiales bacterium]|nr:MAG: hypothetical protein EKK52_06400 [Burkholderiales bacterium]